MKHPPKLAQHLLCWFLREDLAEEVQGDLEEQFTAKREKTSAFIAHLNYWYQVCNYLRPFAIKHIKSANSNYSAMFRHNFIISLRSFNRYRTTFFINLMGLSTGLACALLIYLWVNDELSVDHFNEKDDQLYQVLQNTSHTDGIQTIEATQGLLARALAEELPEVDVAVSVVPASWFLNAGILSYEDTRIKINGQYAGKDFFRMFSYEFLQGDKNQVLNEKYNIAISEDLALRLFHTTDEAIGKTVIWDDGSRGGQFTVTGIFKKPSPNATEQFDLVFNYELFFEDRPGLQSWVNSDPYTYILLKKGTDISQFNDKIADFIQSKDRNQSATLMVRKYSDKYLYNHYENGVQTGGRIEYVRLFSIIAIFILVIACINFMNLSTAKASRRIKEVGVKKAIGAARKTLIFQYLSESFLITFLSMLLAMLLVLIFLPQFNAITGKHLTLHFDPNLILIMTGILCFTGLIAGSYPALYLSGFNPAVVLKGKLNTSFGELWIRKGLVVFQFALSVILIVSVVVVYQQIDFVQSTNLGYNRDNILHFEMEVKTEDDANFFAPGGAWEQRVEAFLNEVKSISGVSSAANYYHDLTGNHGGLGGVDWEAGDEDVQMSFSNLEVGYDFIETLGIEMVEGRNFSRTYSNERSKIIFNETAIKAMGLTDPIGKTIRLWGQEKEIIGVAKDFHYESLYEEVKPVLLQLVPGSYNIMIKMVGGTERETIARLQDLYHQHYPGLAFDFRFLDNDYQAMYVAEKRVSELSRYFAGLAIVISCLGLFGLAAFTAERRIKEIGIRKILGSSNLGIIYLLSSDFTKMVIAAVFIALPISYFLTAHWLEEFAYRINLAWWYFAGAGLLALLIAWFTVGLQTVKAARINPIQCLKEE